MWTLNHVFVNLLYEVYGFRYRYSGLSLIKTIRYYALVYYLYCLAQGMTLISNLNLVRYTSLLYKCWYLYHVVSCGKSSLSICVYLHSKSKSSICTHWGGVFLKILVALSYYEILLQIPVLSSNTKKGEIERTFLDP